jgi:hypothetical protein
MVEFESVESPKIGEFKGKPVLVMGIGKNKYPWSIGAQKAQAIVEHYDAIKEFAETGTLS